MTARWSLLVSLALLGGCPTIHEYDDGGCPVADQRGGDSSVDLAPAPAKCAAAKGLAGDNLLCVDFDKVTGLSDPALTGWNFTAIQSSCPGWTLMNGKLQITNFSTFMNGSCGFSVPTVNLNDSDKQKYKSVTISVVHKVDVGDQQQFGQIFLGQDLPSRQVSYTTGKNPRQISTLNIDKADLPTGINGVYQFLFKITASSPGTILQNWFIESIAVNAT